MKLLLQALITLSTSFSGFFISYYFVQPNIEYFNDDYCQNLNDMSFGTIYLINNGRGADEDVAITFGMEIPKENIHISFLTSPFEIKEINHHTVILIKKLCPGEDAEITFKTKVFMEKFSIDNFTSKSGNITEVRDILLPWWKLSAFQLKIFSSLAILLISLSFYVASKIYKPEEVITNASEINTKAARKKK